MFKLYTNRAARPMQMLRALLASALLAVVAVPAGAFHFPWDQGHDTTNSNDPPPPGPCGTPECDPCNDGGTRSPVYVATGHCYWADTDVVLRGRPYIGVTRSFNSNDPVVGLFGNGWTIDFDVSLYPANSSGVQQRIYKAPNGKRFVFVRQADGSYRAPASRFETIVETAGGVTMLALDGTRQVFALDGRLLERSDANGNRVLFAYDSFGRTIRLSDANGRFLAITYNSASFIETVTDHGGRVWRYAYDVSGNLVAVTDPVLGVLRYSYVAYRPAGDAFTYNLLSRVVDPSGVEVVAFTYANGRVASYNDGANTFTYTRPTSNTVLAGTVTRTDRLGARNISVYGAQGLVTRDTDALNFVRTYTYDANGRLLTEVDERGGTWASSYDSLGRVLTRTNPLNEVTSFGYSGNDSRPVRFTSPTGRVTTLQYDATGNLSALTDALGSVTRMTWSAQGDPVSMTDAIGGVSSTTYNAAGQPLTLTDPIGRISTYQYDALGRLTQRANAAGETTRYTYDALDRVTAVTDAAGNTISIGYDAASRIVSVTDQKGSSTLMAYDTFGRLTSETAPDGRITTYRYRLDNLLDQITRPDVSLVTYLYDARKFLVSETAGGETVSYSYNGRGELLQATGAGGSVVYSYDAAGRVLTETNNGRTITASRNAEGERAQISLQGGGATQFTRDARGLITQISAGPGIFTFTVDAIGRRTRLGLPNGSSASYAYDAAGQLRTLTHDGAFNAQYQYTYDPASRILNIAGAEADWAYAYDALGRVISATRPSQSFAYAYDAVGNLISDGAVHDLNHRLVQDARKSYNYDGRGNLVREQDRASGALVVYTWNARNQLIRVEQFPSAAAAATRTITFSYDAMGRRASKTDNGVQRKFVYDGNDLVTTLNASNATLTTNTFGPAIDDPLATTTASGSRFYHTDHQGSVVALSDTSAVTTRFAYDPYGATTVLGEQPAESFAYTARERDTDDLYHYRTRYYSTSQKRFLSEDTIGLAGGINAYSYVDGDPINLTDPTGECPMCIWAAGQYARCVASCAAMSAAGSALSGGCLNAGDILGDCALDCVNPLNWGGKGAAAKGAAKNSASAAAKGAAGGPRAGKPFTRAGKNQVKADNAANHAGQTTCTNCGTPTVPAKQSQPSVTPPGNETHVDHIIPKSKGGNGSPDNGQVLCRDCNLKKSDN